MQNSWTCPNNTYQILQYKFLYINVLLQLLNTLQFQDAKVNVSNLNL